MAILAFPPIDTADEQGLLAIGGDLEVASLLLAYQSGIFPWPFDRHRILWFAPPLRGILDFNELHIAKRLARTFKSGVFEFAIDRNFAGVIEACSQLVNRGTQGGTWITPAIKRAYLDLHLAGFCHSYETYLNGELVGGIYGVRIGNFCSGESMFYRHPNASKVALIHMIEHLREEGLDWMDCQMLTPVTTSFGGKEIPRKEFMERLEKALG